MTSIESRRTKSDIISLKQEIEKQIAYYESLHINISLRQLYYRLVSFGILRNNIFEYKFLSKKLSEWRKDNQVSEIFTDEGRIFRNHSKQTNPLNSELNTMLDILDADIDFEMLNFQPLYIEIWMEKLALNSIFNPICSQYNINFQICRGYNSVTIIKHAIKRFESIGIPKLILYFGDFDPSGLDIYRHLQTELKTVENLSFKRIAITQQQAQDLHLIPNFAKENDSRTIKFLESNKNETYELDAIEPTLLQKIIEQSILTNLDLDLIKLNNTLSEKRNILYQIYLLNRIKQRFHLS